ncbi:LysE/ArgO family amino acid transporter [Paenibacillus solani]|uniref:LysE/ArgO family amino acid transporter n=1 Tax=Paenibacillus solani TaxID=1705565 RepID=UPI003D2A148A
MTPLMKGIILGFSIAAPVGPIGVLCIKKTLSQGRSYGFIAGLGAATADAIYGCIAAFGLTIISQFLLRQSNWINLLGAVFLLYLAYVTFRVPVRNSIEKNHARNNYYKTFGTTLFLTLTNPLTIVSFIGIFAGMNIGPVPGSSVYSVLGVFIGSATWWLLLSFFVGLFRRMISLRTMKLII